MAKTTTNLALPYPETTDSDNVPADIKALAEALDDLGLGLAGSWRTVLSATQPIANGLAGSSVTPYLCGSGVNPIKMTENLASAEPPFINWDPAVHALPGMTTKTRLRYSLLTNATAPGTTFTPVVCEGGSVAGGANQLVISTPAVYTFGEIKTPAASTRLTGVSTEGDASEIPAGILFLGVRLAATIAANSYSLLGVELQVRNV